MKPAHPVTATGPSAAVTGAIAVSRLGGSLQQQQQQRSAGVRYRLPCRGARTSATSSSAAMSMARLHRGFIYSSSTIISGNQEKAAAAARAWRARALIFAAGHLAALPRRAAGSPVAGTGWARRPVARHQGGQSVFWGCTPAATLLSDNAAAAARGHRRRCCRQWHALMQ
jgi:hypothetical protein